MDWGYGIGDAVSGEGWRGFHAQAGEFGIADTNLFSTYRLLRLVNTGTTDACYLDGVLQNNHRISVDQVIGIRLNNVTAGTVQGRFRFAFAVDLNAPSGANVAAWEAYLAARFGITLP